MPSHTLANALLLPELKLIRHEGLSLFVCQKTSKSEVCPRCATLSSRGYDHRTVRIKDWPLRSAVPTLVIIKRRFWCVPCGRPFTEPVRGVLPRKRTTQRFRAAVLAACERTHNLSRVARDFRVSQGLVYTIHYEQLELRRRQRNQYPWPEQIGIDEHGMGKNPVTKRRQYVSLIVNHSRGKLMEVVPGKSTAELYDALKEIPGRENVLWATIDMCDPYRNFVRMMFPRAHLVADKFHVVRLLSPAILRERRRIVGNNANRRARGLLLASSKKLSCLDRIAIRQYLEAYPALAELYELKESIQSLYRIKNPRAAATALDTILLAHAASTVPEVRTCCNTLQKWKVEILNYFHKRITNARLEAFNNKASLVRRRAYGYQNFNNYRLQLLNACS